MSPATERRALRLILATAAVFAIFFCLAYVLIHLAMSSP